MEKSSERPLVSIIIPAYNAARYIKETLDSALAQTYPNIEVIVIDNASTDTTREVLKPYIEKGAIMYFHLSENKAASGARNVGIKNAHGEFVAFLDSDDIFSPTKIEHQIEYLLDHPDCGVCYCGIWHFYDTDPGTLLTLGYEYYSGNEVFPHIIRKNFINPLSVVMRKSVIDRVGVFDEHYRKVEDWEYWIRLARHGVFFSFLPEPLGKYRMRKAGLWYSLEVRRENKQIVVDMFKELKKKMSSAERKKYHMNYIILDNTIKLRYIQLESIFPLLGTIYEWLQKSRLSRT